MKILIPVLVCCWLATIPGFAEAQSPGLIVRPAGGIGVTSLNPNGDAYSSATTAGFTTDDIGQSELPFKVVPPAITEPTGDLATGPAGGFSDIVSAIDGSGFYIYKDASNIYFRLRVGSIISGSKGYSVLIDTDDKMGSSGPYADPNYVAPSGSSPGNPGFEYEVELQTNFQVAVYSIDGTSTPGSPSSTYSLNSNSQISVALSVTSGNPDYFYDWYVPLSAIGNPASIRMAVTTVTSPNSALQGTRSDIYGINDALFASTAAAWQTVINAQPLINLAVFTGVGATCTAAPVITSLILPGSGVPVSGTWSSMDGSKPSSATITLYRNGSVAGTTTASSGGSWTIPVATVLSGDIFYAMALASGESACLQSNTVTATACTASPVPAALVCGSLKGISGTMPSTAAGNSVIVYQVPATSLSPYSNPVSTPANLTYPTTTSFAYYTNGCSGGPNNVATGLYMVVVQNGSCQSAPVFLCISSGSSGTPPALSTNGLTLTQALYPYSNSVTGSGSASGDILRLFINGQYKSTITALGATFSFTGLTLNAGDQVKIYSQTGSSCMTQSALFAVNCFLAPPSITVNATGNLITGATTVSGVSAYPGASLQLYKGVYPAGSAIGSPVVVNNAGSWSVPVTALVGGDNYYALQTYNGCTSPGSASAAVLTPASCPLITGTYASTAVSVSGTFPSMFTGTVRLYADGNLIGSQAVSAALSWNTAIAAGTLYYGAVLMATAQAAGGAESAGCPGSIVNCAAAPTPSITPTAATIITGQTVNFSVSNSASGYWYALFDSVGDSYATSIYQTNGNVFTLTSSPFSTAGTYSMQLSANDLTGCPPSYALASVKVNPISLTLQLISFEGSYADGLSSFSWVTSEEKNTDYFELQESPDGKVYYSQGQIKDTSESPGQHSYQYSLHQVLQSPLYCRLKIVDKDGKATYSTVILLSPAFPAVHWRISPNPFDDRLSLTGELSSATPLVLRLVDIYGHTLINMSENAVKGENQFVIGGLSQLSAGTYILIITGNGGQTFISKLLKK